MIQTLDELRAFAKASHWRFAHTMPENPHEYVVRNHTNEAHFLDAASFIQGRGSEVVFHGRPYRCVTLDGWRYWTMGNPLAETTIINRARTSS
jgi:hypothetical protein